MTLPTSGPLSFSAINTELGRLSTAQMSLQTAETGGYVAINQASPSKPNGAAPYAVSEWYGYNQNASSAGTLSLEFYKNVSIATARAFINGTQVISRTASGNSSVSINAGDTFYASCTTGFINESTIIIESNTRGILYSSTVNGSLTSDTFTRQNGENITISVYADPPPPEF